MPGQYPNYTVEEKSTSKDTPGRQDICNASDYNNNVKELFAHQGILINHDGRISILEDSGPTSNFTDGTRTVNLCNGTYSILASGGSSFASLDSRCIVNIITAEYGVHSSFSLGGGFRAAAYFADPFQDVVFCNGANAVETSGGIAGVHKTSGGFSAVPNGTYTVGIGATQNGTITITDGLVTSIQEAIA